MRMEVCEVEEEDEVAKWQRWERDGAVIKKPYPLFAFKGFWETAPRLVPF